MGIFQSSILPDFSVLAYLDPGSGVVLAQMLLAGLAGIGLFLKYQGRRLLALFGFKNPPAPGEENDES